MTDPISAARTAREQLAQGLAALQTPGVPPHLMDVAEPIAQAMSVLHRIEASRGAVAAESAPLALESVRRALALLQSAPPGYAAVDQAMEAVAGSLGLIHSLTRAPAAPAAPAPHVPVAAQPAYGNTFVMDQGPATQPSAGMRRDQYEPRAEPPAPVQGWGAAQPGFDTQGGFAAQAQPAGYGAAAPVQPPWPQAPAQAGWSPPAEPPQPVWPQQQQPAAQAEPRQQYAQHEYAPPPAYSPNAPQQYVADARYGAQPGAAGPQPAGYADERGGYAAQPGYGAPQPAPAWPQAPPAWQQSPAQGGWQEQRPEPARAPAPAPAPVPMPAAAPSQAAQRRPGSAAPLRIDAALGAHSPSNFYKGLAGNDVIDSGGIFVATYQIPKVGQDLIIKVSLPGGYEFEALGVVRWARDLPESGADAPPGFGAQFTQISPEGRQLVYRYVRNREPLFHDDL